LRSKKDNNDSNQSSFSKIKDFIKDNAGKITFLSFVPMLAEEGLASLHGLKFAKNSLSKVAYGATRKFYAAGFASYVGLAAAAALGIKAASCVRDKVANL
jgi:hypothetical protein